MKFKSEQFLILTILLGSLAACAVTPPPVVIPPSPTPPVRAVQSTIRGSTNEAPLETVAFLSDDNPLTLDWPCSLTGSRAVCTLTTDGYLTVQGYLNVTAPGYQPYRSQGFYLDADGIDLADSLLVPTAPPVVRLHVQERQGLHDPAGRYVPAFSLSGFQLIELMAHGREGEAIAFVRDTMGPATFVRIFLMAPYLFNLAPQEGLLALPATLDLLAHYGKYAEVTLFADTGAYPNLDYHSVANEAARICSEKPACAAIELGNELSPVHDTQDNDLADVDLLKELRRIIKAWGEIPVSLGSTHDGEDESDIFRDGDYLTVHGARQDGDEIPGGDSAGWRWPRHTNEQRALADRLNKWVWNDESRRNDLVCGKHLGIALLTRLFRLGDTFHFLNGLFAQPMDAAEQAAFACRSRGWSLIPPDWYGAYANAGSSIPRSPVKSFEGAVRFYSSIAGNAAYVLGLGVEPSVRLDWDDSWPVRELVVNDNNVQLWKVSR